MVVVIAAAASSATAGRRAIRAIPDDRRREVFSRTLDDFEQSCTRERPDALKDHCRELASFLLQFDECRGECQGLVRRQLIPEPTR